MSAEYNEYLETHKSNVIKGLRYLMDAGIIPYYSGHEALVKAANHDESKYSLEEYEAYDDYFYGRENADEDDKKVIDDTFDYAWLHHIHCNPHHWQYWVLTGDDENEKVLEMPASDVYEMIADWWSFSWKNGDLNEIFKWYDDHKERMKLHPKTRKMVEYILKELKKHLEKQTNYAE